MAISLTLKKKKYMYRTNVFTDNYGEKTDNYTHRVNIHPNCRVEPLIVRG